MSLKSVAKKYRQTPTPAQKSKIHTVMSEFKRRTLRSGSGGKVTSRKQAIAIGMHESGLSRRRR